MKKEYTERLRFSVLKYSDMRNMYYYLSMLYDEKTAIHYIFIRYGNCLAMGTPYENY